MSDYNRKNIEKKLLDYKDRRLFSHWIPEQYLNVLFCRQNNTNPISRANGKFEPSLREFQLEMDYSYRIRWISILPRL